MDTVIDTHCHLDLIEERGLKIEDVLKSAYENGVSSLVQIATDLKSSCLNKNLSQKIKKDNGNNLQKNPDIYWTAGLHPCNVKEIASLDDIFSLIKENYKETNLIGIGETGLDYFHEEDVFTLNQQKESFAKHLQLAKELGLAIILHARDDRSYNPEKTKAIHDAFDMIKEIGVRGVLHCYTYTEKEAFAFVDLGWFVSYSGVITFPNAKPVQAGAVKLPLECLLVETDAPYLAPLPHRGKINQPSYVQHTLNFLAELRAKECNEDVSMVKETILANSRRFLNLKKIA